MREFDKLFIEKIKERKAILENQISEIEESTVIRKFSFPVFHIHFSDICLKLSEVSTYINSLIEKHGPDAVIEMDYDDGYILMKEESECDESMRIEKKEKIDIISRYINNLDFAIEIMETNNANT